jgi:membrane fusion protein, copper/silver efflux system
VLFMLVLIAAFSAGMWYRGKISGKDKTAPVARMVLHYICPMHPQYNSDKPGDCPSCGMRLVPVYAGETAGRTHADEDTGIVSDAIHASPENRQLIGVRVARVERAGGTATLRTAGRVAPDETRTYVINATVDGWINATSANSTGSFVKKNEVLATFYSPEFLSATQALLFALNSIDRAQAAGNEGAARQSLIDQFNLNLQQSKDALRNLGMGEPQIKRLIDTRKYTERVDITSPSDGFILVRKVSDGLRFKIGDEMYRIADLSRVWVLVDVFEQEEKYLRPGDRVRVSLPNQGTSVVARVTNVLPQFDPASRSLKVRLEAENPGFRLRPDMFVDVSLPVSEASGISVPSDAVIDTGLKKRVFVDRGNGYFEPRDVETGWRFGGRVEILKGLMEGERIVVSGTFLIDSESRMKAAASGIYGESAKDPVCGMQVDPANAGDKKSNYGGTTYYFCSDGCKQRFDKNPEKFVAQLRAIQRSSSRLSNAKF